jgi:hypothetical protein
MTNSHFLNRYNKIVSYFKNSFVEGFVEKHHIVPKCIGGTDEPNNIVVLPARAHFICHYLLHKAYLENRQLAHAFAMMLVNNPHQGRNTSKLYEKAKMARSIALKGVPRPEWVKEKLRKPKSRKENYKRPKSNSHKQNISNSLKGKKHTWQHKVFTSEGYIELQKKRKEKKQEQINFHRENFVRLQIPRKDYYKLFPELGSSTIKHYLVGL